MKIGKIYFVCGNIHIPGLCCLAYVTYVKNDFSFIESWNFLLPAVKIAAQLLLSSGENVSKLGRTRLIAS